MKGLDVFIVRFVPFILYIITLRGIYLSLNGIEDYPFNLFHSHSVIYALSLYCISRSNPKYHCIWNRAMYIEIIAIPLINYIDAKFFALSIEYYVVIVVLMTVATAIATAYLAIRHFWKLNKKKICQTN